MGWYFNNHKTSKKELISELIQSEEWNSINEYSRRTIAHCLRGNVLWSVVEITQKHATNLYILCDVLVSKKHPDGGYTWGYKPMSEIEGPYYYTCPLKYLAMAPSVNEVWRNKVRDYHLKRNPNWSVSGIGQVIEKLLF